MLHEQPVADVAAAYVREFKQPGVDSMSLMIREAMTEEEREAMYRFRYRLYVSDLRSTGEADHARRWLRDLYDEHSSSYAVFDDASDSEQVVGSVRLIALAELPDPSELIDRFEMGPAVEEFGLESLCTISRFMLDRSLRHGKIVYRLVRALFEMGLSRQLRVNYSDCSPHLLPFYEHLGYRRYTRGFNDTADGYKLPILMLARDREHLALVHSPLERHVAIDNDDSQARDWFRSQYPEYISSTSAPFLPEDRLFALLGEQVADDPLREVGLLRGLSREQAQKFLSQATVIDIEPGDLVIREGEVDNTLFVLLSGLAEAVAEGSDGQAINVLGAGDTFGEIGFLTRVARTLNVVARTHSRVLVISGDWLERFIASEPTISAIVLLNLSRELAARLAFATHRYAGGTVAPASA